MATIDACRAALERLAGSLGGSDNDHAGLAFDRTLSCHVPDLDITFSGRLAEGRLRDITIDPSDRAQIRLTAESDDLVALTSGELSFAKAWLAGRVKVDATVRDLLRLRSML